MTEFYGSTSSRTANSDNSEFYIYLLDQDGIRDLEEGYVIYKIGSTTDIEGRKCAYFTGHPHPPKYFCYFRFLSSNIVSRFEIEKNLKEELLVDKWYCKGGGVEFYKFRKDENIVETLSDIFKNQEWIFEDPIMEDNFTQRPKRIKKYKESSFRPIKNIYFERVEEEVVIIIKIFLF